MQDIRTQFEENVRSKPEAVAIKYKEGGSWTDISYGELGKKIRMLASYLLEKGIKKNDRVGVLMNNRPEWPVVFFAAIFAGASAVPLDARSTPDETGNILKNAECAMVFTEEGTASLVDGTEEAVVSIESDLFKSIFRSGKIQDLKIEISSDDTACILYTSGTTAEPKGVMLSHRNLLSNCASLEQLNIVNPADRVLSVLPLHHIYPLTVTLLLPLSYGGSIVYAESMRPEAMSEAMKKTGATVFPGVPQLFAALHKKIIEGFRKTPFPVRALMSLFIDAAYEIRKRTGINLSRYLLFGMHNKFGRAMRLFVSGGAKLDAEVARDMRRFGFTLIEGYGLTETSPVLTLTPLKKPKFGSAGLPIPDVDIKIIDKDAEGVGEILARGPNIMRGYYKRPDLTEKVISNGWFHTGDLGYFDPDGHLFITGRSKDVIVLSSGMNVYPDEVEKAYMKEVPAKEMCVFEMPPQAGTDEILELWAVVVPDLEFFKKYGEVNLRNVIKERFNNVSRTLPAHLRVMNFFITLEDLPKTLLGKLKRYEVKNTWIAKSAREELPPEELKCSEEDLEMMESGLGVKVIDYLAKQTGIKKTITPPDLLELDLGIDSLGRIELGAGLEKALGIKIEEEIIGKAFTVGDLIAGLKALVPADMTYQITGEETSSSPINWKENLADLPKKENLDRIDLKPGLFAWIAGYLFLLPFWLIFKIFFSFRVVGKENLPEKGPYILYVNHTSYFDGLLVAVALPHFPSLDMFFLGFRPYFNVPVIRNLVKIGRIVPLDFSAHLLEAMKSCYYVLKNERNICLFPEGLRTIDGKVGKFKKGFGILAKETGAALVPVFLEGAYESWPRTVKYPRRHPITIRIGEPVKVKKAEYLGNKLGATDKYEAICAGARQILIDEKGE